MCETKEQKIARLIAALKELTGDDYTPVPRVIENTNYVSNK